MTIKNSAQLIIPTFKMAWDRCNPQTGPIFHSDCGAQYTAYGFHRLLYEHSITQSFPIVAALMTVRWPSPSLLHTSYKICI